MNTATQPTCAERVAAAWQSRRADLKAMLDPSAEDLHIKRSTTGYRLEIAEYTVQNDNGADLEFSEAEIIERNEAATFDAPATADLFDDHENHIRRTAGEAFGDYGLGFDYVAPYTFDDQPTGYWRYQLSWGGPSEEIRFYGSPRDRQPARAEFWFLDWFDGAPEDVTGDPIINELWDTFADMAMLESAYEDATE